MKVYIIFLLLYGNAIKPCFRWCKKKKKFPTLSVLVHSPPHLAFGQESPTGSSHTPQVYRDKYGDKQYEQTRLHTIATIGTIKEAIGYLKAKSEGLDHQDAYKMTPLYLALYHNRDDMAKFLLQKGASLELLPKSELGYKEAYQKGLALKKELEESIIDLEK